MHDNIAWPLDSVDYLNTVNVKFVCGEHKRAH